MYNLDLLLQYGDMYNFSEKVYEKAIREGECISESEDESDEEMDTLQDSDAEEMEDTDSEVEYVAEDEVEFSDMSDMEVSVWEAGEGWGLLEGTNCLSTDSLQLIYHRWNTL